MIEDQYKQQSSAKEKKDDSHAPSSSYRSLMLPFCEPQGSGLPDRSKSAHEFVRPSNTSYFTIINTRKPRLRAGYHVATSTEIIKLNKYAKSLVKIAKFYDHTLSNGKIFYVFKRDNYIESLPVKYGKNNFSHLTGLIFDRKNARQMLEDVSQGQLKQNAILVKNDYSTFEKLQVLDRLANVISSKNSVLSNLSQTNKQAQKLNLNAAVKSFDDSYLLAYRYFDPDIMRPVSLINLQNTRKGYSDYLNVPEEKVLAVLSETPNKMGGFSIGTLSINNDYLNDSKQLVEIMGKMQKLVVQEYLRQKAKNKFSRLSQKKEKHHRER